MVAVSRLLVLHSSERRQLIDITAQVLSFAEEVRVKNGICVISVPHATAAVIANEHESGLMQDILTKIEALFPESSRYGHNAIDDNADAHLAATFLGHSRMFPIVDGRLVRGTWQSIFLIELDGPRSRREVCLQAIGEN
jgi:secondary thiamine-phosphate synthase enzyme